MSIDASSTLSWSPATRPASRGRAVVLGLAVFALVGLLVAGAATWAAFFRPTVEIVDVQARSVVAGNGKPNEVVLAYRARRADIKGVEIRFVRGDGSWTPSNWTVPFDGVTRETGQVTAGSLSHRTTAPMRATFEYTLITRDGGYSAPFEKTFDIVPPAAITQAVASPRVQVGQPFSVSLGYRKGGGDIVKVVRRVVESDVAWEPPEQTTAVQFTQDSGQFDVRFEAPARPMRATLEFTLVDALGIQSEPVRIPVTATAVARQVAASTYGTVLSVVRLGGATGTGAVAGAAIGGALGNQIGRGSGRALATFGGALGGAYLGHQAEQSASGAPLWETTVQLDGGGVSRVRHADAPRWSAGSRVRVNNGVVSL